MHDISIYKELYHFDDKHCLVINEISNDVFLMKRLMHFERSVYDFLLSNRNEHIPEVYDIFEDGEELIVIEEYVRGSTFDAVIDNHSMSGKTKLKYFISLLEGLKFLHSATPPIIHRDLKPSNILFDETGKVWIIDYDAAKTFKKNSTEDTVLLGTNGRAAPEQYGFKQSDARTDIYAVGRMLKDAFPDDSRIEKIAAKAMSFDPDNRYSNVDELINVLTRKIGSSTKLKPLLPPPGFRSRTWWKIPIAVIGYPFIIYCSLAISVDGGDVLTLLIIKLSTLVSMLTIVDIFTSWTGLYDVFPFVDHKNIFVRCIAKLFYACLMTLAWLAVFILVGGIIKSIVSV
ncbi:MAG: protein kinase [Clostridiales bacterium]|nr:protein kinase [Clostridiales bacterium]